MKTKNPSAPVHQHGDSAICTADAKCHVPGAHQHRVPKELLRRRPFLFMGKVALAAGIIAGSSALMLSGSLPLCILGMFTQGAIYVHMLELLHSALHLHAFSSHRLSRVVGFLLGLPMMVAYSQYQYVHMGHHKWLGTDRNTETFSYQDGQLNSVSGMLKGMFDYSRLGTVAHRIWCAFSGQTISDGKNAMMEERIKEEHRLFGYFVLALIALSILTGSIAPLMLWLAPLIFAEPAHFLMALPDHMGLPAHSNPNVFVNTRTIRGSWFSHWYTNYSTYHMAHHYNMNVPIENIPELQELLEHQLHANAVNQSYPEFYAKVVKGDISAEK